MQRTAAQEAIFTPVQPPTTFEETVERLGTAIRIGLLAPGSRLPPERDLADQLHISRSTLRQALTTLVESGHLASHRGRGGGTFVTAEPPLVDKSALGPEPLGDDAWAVLDERVAIETGAVILACERSTPEDVERLRESVALMGASADFDEYRRADVRFHLGVAEAARSPRLVQAMTDVQGQMSALIGRIAHPRQVLSRSNTQHRRLVDLLERRETSKAVRLMRDHIEGTEHILVGLLPPGQPARG